MVNPTPPPADEKLLAQIEALERAAERHRRIETSWQRQEVRLADFNRILNIVLTNTHMMAAYLDPRFNFIWVNKAYADTCRHDPAFFPGKNHFDLYPHEENQIIFQNVVDTGIPFFVAAKPFEFPDQPERGTTYWDWSLIPVKDASDRVTGLVFTLAEVTEHKRLEEDRLKWERRKHLLQKARSLNRMAGAIAHRFNNMLGAVLGNLELAMTAPHHGGAIDPHVVRAFHSARKAADISGMMLTYLGQTFEPHERVDLSATCRQTLAELKQEVRDDLVMESDIPSECLWVHGDATHIRQGLRNLVVNAAEAIQGAGGTISVTLQRVPSTDLPESHRYPLDWRLENETYACITVADTGCGISPEDIEQLFDPFFTDKFTGRGLGLPVLLGIARAHHGGVTVESTPGKGSRFRVFIPPVEDLRPPR